MPVVLFASMMLLALVVRRASGLGVLRLALRFTALDLRRMARMVHFHCVLMSLFVMVRGLIVMMRCLLEMVRGLVMRPLLGGCLAMSSHSLYLFLFAVELHRAYAAFPSLATKAAKRVSA
jgi:hypothetical protein